jgi:Mrp family chromosome partitioning ATPase
VDGSAQRKPTRREGVREGLTVVLASVAAFTAGATALSLLRDGDYESTALVSGAPSGEPAPSLGVARRAVDAAGASRGTAGALLDHLKVEQRLGGEVAFKVRAEEPATARRLAASYARAWVDALPRRAEARAGPAGLARRRRDTARAALTGAAIGLLAGLLLALAREGIDVRRSSSRSVAARLGLKELGQVPERPGEMEEAHRLPALESPERAAAEAYARLGARVAAEAREASARVVLVCGTVATDYGEQVAAGLGAALAAEGRKVAVVELDPERPMLRRLFALARRPGAAEIARGETTLDEALTPVQAVSGLHVLAAGAGFPVGSGPAAAVLDALRERFDFVVVAGPPLLGDGETAVAGADALLLAVDLRRTRYSRRPRLERVLGGLDVPVLGFVLMASTSSGAELSAPRA